MPGAVIVADQPAGAGSGVPGTARQDLWLSQPVNLSIATSGNSSQAWELLDVPPGSATVLDTPTLPTCSFTPDLVGTYRLRLITNGGGAGNIQILVFRVRYNNVGALADRGWALPGLGESGTDENNYDGNARGYDQVLRFIFADLLPWASGVNVLQNGTLVGQQRSVNFIGSFFLANNPGQDRVDVTLDRYIEIPFLAGTDSSSATTPGTAYGARQLKMGALPRGAKSVYLVASLQSNAAGAISWVELWNVSRAYMVTGAQLSNTGATDPLIGQTFESAVLPVGTAAGNIRTDTDDEYELRGYRAGGSAGDFVSCTNAHLRMVYDNT